MMLSNGADVNAADHAGITPLMLAASIPSPIHAATLIEWRQNRGNSFDESSSYWLHHFSQPVLWWNKWWSQ